MRPQPRPAELVVAARGERWPAEVERVTAGWLAGQRSPHTRNAYRRGLAVWFAWCEQAAVDPYDPPRHAVATWVTEMSETDRLAPDTVRVRCAAVHGWHAELSLCALRPNNDPMVGLRLPRASQTSTVVALSTDHVRILLDAARQMRSTAETSIALMATMGLRASEAGTVNGGEIQPTPWGPCLLVIRKGATKALIPVTSTAQRAANRVGWPGADLAQFGPIDANRARNRVYASLKAAARRAGLTGVHPHQLRHWFVTSALEAGVPLHTVQDSAGHSNPSTTRRYDRLAHSIKDHAAHTVDRLLGDDGVVLADEPRG